MECTQPLDEVDKKLGFVCPRWSTAREEDYGSVVRKKRNNRTELNVLEWFRVSPSSDMRDAVYVVQGNHGIPPLSRPLLWAYHCFYISRLYRDGFVRLGTTKERTKNTL